MINIKKVAIVASHLSGKGGTETVISSIGKSSKINNKFKLDLFVMSKMKYLAFGKNLKFNKILLTNFKNKFICLIRYALFLSFFNGDALIITGPKMIMLAYYIRKIFKKKYKIVSWSHFAIVPGSFQNDISKLLYADYHLVISTGIKNQLINAGVSSQRIKVVFNPVSIKNRTIYPDKDKCKFIYIGRSVWEGQKNIKGLLNCLAKIDGNWELDMYGDGPDFEKIKEFVNENLSNKVRLKGWKENPWSNINNANCLLLNSNFEGFGMVIAEALSYGVPCVSSNCPSGPDDLINDGVNGFLYPIGDYKELTRIIEMFIDEDLDFDPKVIKKSISGFYKNNYEKRFVKSLDEILR